MSKNKTSSAIVIGMGVFVVMALIAMLVIFQAQRSKKVELDIYGQVPQFTFTERQNEPFGTDQMMGEINVVDFIFTRCQGACPVMATKMQRLYAEFSENPGVRLVSISVDPAHDTLEVLQQYAIDHGVTDQRWVFLHAPIEDVVTLSEKGFMLPADNLPMGHSSKFALVDAMGQIRGYYDSFDDTEVDQLIIDIKRLRGQ
ncbi:SCO family protein [bacterium]|nr:SCO family protein [bacterium]